MKHILYTSIISLFVCSVYAQKKNVNAAWRALTDYQSTLNDKPNISYLLKAKESIDLAIQNSETKDDSRALTYCSQIYYELYKYYKNNPDHTINPYAYLSYAIDAYHSLQEKHPKVANTPEVQSHAIMLLNTSNQEAVKLFNDKQYSDASQFFYQHYILQKKILHSTDTAGIFNAFVSAYKSNQGNKIEQIGTEIIQNNLDNVKVYQLLYNYYQHKNDTMNMNKILKQGRNKYPNDMTLLNLETDYYLNNKKFYQAINNLEQMIQKDTANALVLLTLGNLYDNMANQRMNNKNYSDTTEQYFQNAIRYYLKSYRHKQQLDKDNLFTLTYNIGAYYSNYGLYYYNKKMKEFKIIDLSQKQKEVEDKRKEYSKMGLPYLKEAENIKPDDKNVITALYRVYALIRDDKNADIYKNKMLGR